MPLTTPILTTERLTLRPLAAEDRDAIVAVQSDGDALRYWDEPARTDTARFERFLARTRRMAEQDGGVRLVTVRGVCKADGMTSCLSLRGLASGILVANAIPHAYAAALGARHLTPLAGRQSGPTTNAAWSALNLVAAVALARSLDADSVDQRKAFKAGVAGFAAWVLASEWVTDLNG